MNINKSKGQSFSMLDCFQFGDEASKFNEFASWVASIGDGVIGGPNDDEVNIHLLWNEWSIKLCEG